MQKTAGFQSNSHPAIAQGLLLSRGSWMRIGAYQVTGKNGALCSLSLNLLYLNQKFFNYLILIARGLTEHLKSSLSSCMAQGEKRNSYVFEGVIRHFALIRVGLNA
jgi:hypothetical protein